jgi:hypothetical protein
MSQDDTKNRWLGKLTGLNPAAGRGACQGKAPHKPLLLLALIDLAEAGELTTRALNQKLGDGESIRKMLNFAVGRCVIICPSLPN